MRGNRQSQFSEIDIHMMGHGWTRHDLFGAQSCISSATEPGPERRPRPVTFGGYLLQITKAIRRIAQTAGMDKRRSSV